VPTFGVGFEGHGGRNHRLKPVPLQKIRDSRELLGLDRDAGRGRAERRKRSSPHRVGFPVIGPTALALAGCAGFGLILARAGAQLRHHMFAD
jgi:hypothetical protein